MPLTLLGPSHLLPLYHTASFRLQPAKFQKAAFNVKPCGHRPSRNARVVAQLAQESVVKTPVREIIPGEKRGAEIPLKDENDDDATNHYGKIRSTLGIPSAMEWTVPRLPDSPLQLFQMLSSFGFQDILSNPQKGQLSVYAFGRTAFFTGILAFAARNADLQILKSDQEYLQEFLGAQIGPIWASIREMHRIDSENVSKGYYAAPHDMDLRHRQWDPAFVLSEVNTFMNFMEGFLTTRKEKGRRNVLRTSIEAKMHGKDYPDYYLQNFHFQKDGWLSASSAESYDVATEAIFSGAQDAMQRQGLVPLHFFMKGRRQEDTRLLELACGTGRYLTFIKDNYPLLNTTAVDLSPFYLEQASKNVDYLNDFKRRVSAKWKSSPTEFVQAAAEKLPFESESFDVVSCVYLFHELPPSTRKKVVAEMNRILKPNGVVIFQDSWQKADYPDVYTKLSFFPSNYHEPYYMSYISTDLPKLFGEQGFELESCSVIHAAKVLTFRKLPRGIPNEEDVQEVLPVFALGTTWAKTLD